MDVLKPELLLIEGIQYRINQGNYPYEGEKVYEAYDNYEDLPQVESISDGEEEFEEIEGGRYKTHLHIAKTYFPYIIGSKGSTRKRLETETRSKILIPKQGHDGDIVITAATKKGVASARRRIRMMVLSSRKRQTITHFISIPMNGCSYKNGFLDFKSEVLEKCSSDRGVKESIFQTPERLHLTIGVMVLCDEIDRNEAAIALEECNEIVIKPLLGNNKLTVVMCGIEYMNDDPSEVDVLYAKVICKYDDTLLQEIADGINLFFSKKGLLERERDHIKLHATLMNTKFGKNEKASDDEKPILETFDAHNIIKNFHDFYFGEENITSIEISMMHSSSKNGYYQVSASTEIIH